MKGHRKRELLLSVTGAVLKGLTHKNGVIGRVTIKVPDARYFMMIEVSAPIMGLICAEFSEEYGLSFWITSIDGTKMFHNADIDVVKDAIASLPVANVKESNAKWMLDNFNNAVVAFDTMLQACPVVPRPISMVREINVYQRQSETGSAWFNLFRYSYKDGTKLSLTAHGKHGAYMQFQSSASKEVQTDMGTLTLYWSDRAINMGPGDRDFILSTARHLLEWFRKVHAGMVSGTKCATEKAANHGYTAE